jgi:SAM-dependent methyltransferase
MLDLDAEVLAEPSRAARAEISELVDAPVRRILDLGAGTGTGTFGLLRHFPDAHAVAVDGSEEMLTLLRVRAEQLGLSQRVTAVPADLDEGLPELDPVDLIWAAASMHHLADPDRTLAQLVSAMRAGGLLAVIEMSGLPRFLPADTPAGAVEARAHALLKADRAIDMPTMGDDWGVRLSRAGLTVETARVLVFDLAPPVTPIVAEYATATLRRIRGAVADRLEPADLVQFDALLEGGVEDLRTRGDLHVSTERHLWIARRPTPA